MWSSTSGCDRAAGWPRNASPRSGSTRCPASAPRSRSACARSASRRCSISSQHRPRRYELAVDEVAISQLWGDEEVAIAGVVQDVRTRRLGGRRTIVTARIKDASGTIGASWFNQPWLVEKLTPGTHLRLRGKLGRYGFDVKSYDVGEAQATADFAPVYPASEQVPSTKLRDLVRVALAQVGRYLPDALPAELDEPLACDAIAAIHFPRDEAEAEAARRRLALDELFTLQLVVAALARRGRRRDRAARAGRARRRATAACCRSSSPSTRSARSPRSTSTSRARRRCSGCCRATSAPGKTVVALYALLRAVESDASGRADGADRDARRAALPDARAALRAARRPLRAPHGLRRLEEDPRRDRERRRADRGRHARADPARRRVRRPRGRRRRRAAPLRRRAAEGARRGTLAARPAHDGDADPAHARADDLRRPRGERDREAAREPQADRDRAGSAPSARRRRTSGCACISTPAGRRTSSAR